MNNNLSQSVNYWNSALLPYYGWGALNAIETLGYARYDAMMLRINRRFANSFSVNFNYTWSHIMDTNDNDSDQHQQPVLHQVQLCQRRVRPAEPGLARLHLPVAEGEGCAGHSGAAGVFRRVGAHGHCPLAIGHAGDHHFQRKPVWREPRQPVSQPGRQSVSGSGSTSSWLNQAAFVRPPDGQWGDLGRDAIRLPHITNVDAGLMKDFAITEKAKLTFRFEIYNLFNHPEPWGMNTGFSGDNPGSGLSASDGNYGYMNAFRDARTLQLALRFAF